MKQTTGTDPQTDNRRQNQIMPRFKRYAVATTLLLLVLMGLFGTYLLRVYRMTEADCYEDLAVETEDAIADLESNLRSDRSMLRVIAGLIGSNGDIGSIEVSGYLSNYDTNSLVTQIGILLPDNEVMSAKGKRGSPDGALSFEDEYSKGEHISGSISSGVKQNAIIQNYVPIRRDGICIGVLFSTVRSSSAAKAWLSGVYDKKGSCYVVNRKTGEIILNSSSEQITNIRDLSFTQTNADYTKEETVNNILDGKKGYSVFASGTASEKLYMCYLPFNIEDWEMVVYVPESAVFSSVAPIRSGMYGLIAAAALCIIIYAIWLVREIHLSISETVQRANIDVLTDLPNRNRYEQHLAKLEGSLSDSDKLICLFIDANGLHELNNSKGHSAGDQMLRFIADSLKVQFGGKHIYRIGGDEFVVFLSGKTEDEISGGLSEFNDALKRNDYHAAVGLSAYSPGMSVDELICSAEKQMYEAKQDYYRRIGKEMRN